MWYLHRKIRLTQLELSWVGCGNQSKQPQQPKNMRNLSLCLVMILLCIPWLNHEDDREVTVLPQSLRPTTTTDCGYSTFLTTSPTKENCWEWEGRLAQISVHNLKLNLFLDKSPPQVSYEATLKEENVNDGIGEVWVLCWTIWM